MKYKSQKEFHISFINVYLFFRFLHYGQHWDWHPSGCLHSTFSSLLPHTEPLRRVTHMSCSRMGQYIHIHAKIRMCSQKHKSKTLQTLQKTITIHCSPFSLSIKRIPTFVSSVTTVLKDLMKWYVYSSILTWKCCTNISYSFLFFVVPRLGIEPGPRRWERRILASRPPANPQVILNTH